MIYSRDDPLEIAKRFGLSVAGTLGLNSFVELELCFASALLPRFNDNAVMRVRQNLLLLWQQSYYKSTLINEFAKTIPDTLGITDITSATPETIFGSINDTRTKIIEPVFAGKRFALITELLSFLGSGNTMKDIVNTLNKVMEGESVTRHLLKFGQNNFSKFEIEKLKQKGIEFDPVQVQLSYKPDLCVIAASRPMDNKTYTYLSTSGHLYRYHIIQHEISDEEAVQHLQKNYLPDPDLLHQLGEFNKKLSEVSLERMKMPTTNVLESTVTSLVEIVQDEISSRKQRIAEIIDIRTKGDVVRELVSHAFIRTAYQNEFKQINELNYTQEDIEFILRKPGHFVEAKINPLFVNDWTELTRKKHPIETVQTIILEFLRDGEMRARREIDQQVMSFISISKATISNALYDLLNQELLCQPKFGFYQIQ